MVVLIKGCGKNLISERQFFSRCLLKIAKQITVLSGICTLQLYYINAHSVKILSKSEMVERGICQRFVDLTRNDSLFNYIINCKITFWMFKFLNNYTTYMQIIVEVLGVGSTCFELLYRLQKGFDMKFHQRSLTSSGACSRSAVRFEGGVGQLNGSRSCQEQERVVCCHQ